MTNNIDSQQFHDEQNDIEVAAKKKGKRLTESYAEYIKHEEGRVVGKEEKEDQIKEHVVYGVSKYHHTRARKELEQYSVSWDNITIANIRALNQALNDAQNEEALQKYLTQNKIFLIQHLGGGHGRYVIPKPKLGAELVPDYLIAELSSIGIEWYGVELESPSSRLCTRRGQASQKLVHAIQQIIEWRSWLESNLSYARNPYPNGLGLVGITSDLPSYILIGRRSEELPSQFNDYRRQTKDRQNIEIHTYDWLLEQAENRAKLLTSGENKHSLKIIRKKD